MLLNSNLKIFEIARRVGYRSTPYFCTVFKSHYSVTPSQYREQNYNDKTINKFNTLKTIASKLKMNSILNVENKVQQVIDELAEVRRENGQLNQQLLVAKVDEMVNQAVTVDGNQYLFVELKDADSSSLKGMVEQLRDKLTNGFVYLTNVSDDKVVFVVGCSKAMIAKGIKAGDVAKKAAQMAGGNGGGRPDIAQAGGKDITKLDEIAKSVREMVGI